MSGPSVFIRSECPNSSSETDGLMSKADKKKIDGTNSSVVKAIVSVDGAIAAGDIVALRPGTNTVTKAGSGFDAYGVAITGGAIGVEITVQRFDPLVAVTVFSNGDGAGGNGAAIDIGDELIVVVSGQVSNEPPSNGSIPSTDTAIVPGSGNLIAVSAVAVNSPGAAVQVVSRTLYSVASATASGTGLTGAAGLASINDKAKIGDGLFQLAPGGNTPLVTTDATTTTIVTTPQYLGLDPGPSDGTVFRVSVRLELVKDTGEAGYLEEEALFVYNTVGSSEVTSTATLSLLDPALAGVAITFLTPGPAPLGGTVNVQVTGLAATNISWIGSSVMAVLPAV